MGSSPGCCSPSNGQAISRQTALPAHSFARDSAISTLAAEILSAAAAAAGISLDEEVTWGAKGG